MITDSHFCIGSSHKVCQDYAVSSVISDFSSLTHESIAYAIVSDGCSSSPDTDIGSRLLAKSAEQNISILGMPTEFHRETLRNARLVSGLFNLSKYALDATLLAVVAEDNNYRFKAYGDGVFVKVMTNGNIEHTIIEFPSGAPYYLNYFYDDERNIQFQEKFGSKRMIKKYINGELISTLTLESHILDQKEAYYTIVEPVYGVKSLSVISDGALSFTKPEENLTSKTLMPVDQFEIIKELVDFKNKAEGFVKRRLQSFSKSCEKKQYKHIDDLSVASILF